MGTSYLYSIPCSVAVPPTNGDSPSSTTPRESFVSQSSDPEKDRVLLVWWTAFGISLFFRPVAEFVIRIPLFSVCALLISTLDGSLNFFIGHAVLRAVKYNVYDPPAFCHPWKPDHSVELL